jgi:hypothetical protein
MPFRLSWNLTGLCRRGPEPHRPAGMAQVDGFPGAPLVGTGLEVVLTRIGRGCSRSARRWGPQRVGRPSEVHDQGLAGHDHHGIVPGPAAELAAADALDCEGQFVASKSSSSDRGVPTPSSAGGLEIVLTEIAEVPTPSSAGGLEIILAEIGGCRRLLFYHARRSLRPDGMRLALDICEGQNLDRKNDHRIRPRRAGAPQFAPVNSLGRNRELVTLGQRLDGATQVLEAPCVT